MRDDRGGRGTVGAAFAYARHSRRRYVKELGELLRFRSVSADPRRAPDLARCARWLATQLRDAGMASVRLIDTGGPPLVIGRSPYRPGRPRLLVYGHYDVQPASPAAWRTPPFRPTIVGSDLVARGASDNKGPLFAYVKAAESMMRTAGRLPLNVTYLFEGEEEIGSPHLRASLERHRRELAGDLVAISDTRMLGPDRPTLVYALRGSLTVEIRVDGPVRALHAGAFGGAVHNPAHALADILSSLHDRFGCVAVPGFYDQVRRPPRRERFQLRLAGPSDERMRRQAGGRPLWGPPAWTAYERTTLLPAVTTIRVESGAPQGITAIPAHAIARVNIRLVPNQTAAMVLSALRAHLSAATPRSVSARLKILSSISPVQTPTRHAVLRPAIEACVRGFGRAPTLLRSGGTIPAVAHLQDVLHSPIILMGFTLPDDNIHGPNERLHLPMLWRAVDTCIWFLHSSARL